MMLMMAVAGRTLGKIDPRLMVCLAYIGTAAGIYNLTRLDLGTSFATITEWRVLQVICLPFVFIPISTLNYVGVPVTKSNQISSLSNFARNLGGSAGTALLTTYLARSSQVHQSALAAHVVPGSPAYRIFTSRVNEMLTRNGGGSLPAGEVAIGQAYRMMVREASMLSYKNAFTILAAVVLLLSPLPFLMRLPPKRGPKPPPEDLVAH
jgi:DHA2 family multidrug resistance protein